MSAHGETTLRYKVIKRRFRKDIITVQKRVETQLWERINVGFFSVQNFVTNVTWEDLNDSDLQRIDMEKVKWESYE